MEPFLATILVLIVTSRNIVLAADSRKTRISDDGIVVKETGDKIYKANEFYFAVSGIEAANERNLDVPSFIHQILLMHSDLETAVLQIATELSKVLRDFFANLRESNEALLEQLLKYRSTGGEIVVTRRVNGIPSVYLLEYRIHNKEKVEVVMNTWKTNISQVKNDKECFWRAIGNTSFISGQGVSEEDLALYPVENAKRIIEEGIKWYPDFIGLPVKVLQIDMSGESWEE